jgi:hypothetical protein
MLVMMDARYLPDWTARPRNAPSRVRHHGSASVRRSSDQNQLSSMSSSESGAFKERSHEVLEPHGGRQELNVELSVRPGSAVTLVAAGQVPERAVQRAA